MNYHQHPILLSPRLAELEIRLPIRDAPKAHWMAPKWADLFGWTISEDGSELVLHDGSVEPESPFVEMIAALDGVLPDMHLVSYDEDQNIKFALTRGIITEVACRGGKGTVVEHPYRQFIARARYVYGTQDWDTRIHLLLELCGRPTTRSPGLLAWCNEGVETAVELRVAFERSATIADLFSTGRMLQLVQQLERVGGDAALVARLRTRTEERHRAAAAKLLAAHAALRPAVPDPQAVLVTDLLGPGSELEQVLATLGPGEFPRREVVLWPAARVASGERPDDTWPAELVPIGTSAGMPLCLDTRFQPQPAVVRDADGDFVEDQDDLLGLLVFGLDSATWND